MPSNFLWKEISTLNCLSLKSSQHVSQLDRNYVDSVFESYSTKKKDLSTPNPDDDISTLTKEAALKAIGEVFTMWKCDLNEGEKVKFKSVYFEQAWDKYDEVDNQMNLKDAYRFLKDVMTSPLIQKDPLT